MTSWLHSLDPVALRIPLPGLPPIEVRWYGLAYLAGFFLAFLLLRRLTADPAGDCAAPDGMSRFDPAEFVSTAAFGVVIGGRLGYALLYNPHLLIDFSARFPFWELLAIWHGGMASHGGMFGVVIATLLYARRRGLSARRLFDLAAVATPPGLGLGRLANFVNGELYGRPAPSWLPWAVRFPQEMAGANPVRIAAIRANPAAAALLTPRHPSQLYEALLEGLVLFLILRWLALREHAQGMIGAWFLILYAIFRFLVEFTREPDAGVGLQWLGLSRGQWLSLAMLGGGIVVAHYWKRGAARESW
jgi:phosphatidylglycerol:prolipoprotein diacylglycerol transferase